MIKLILILLFLYALCISPVFRYAVFHCFKTIYWGCKDAYKYIKYKEYNNCHEYGVIRCNVASGSQVFGCGKTLSLVRYARMIYKRYNGLDVYDYDQKKFIKQHIHIISNVKLCGIPYIEFKSIDQLKHLNEIADANEWGVMDVCIFLLDESGAIFNSRGFRDNFDTETVTKLLQSRKNKMALYMTSQRFQFQDKILRESMSFVTTCKKIWRFVLLRDYDAYQVENCTNTDMLDPVSTKVYLATDLDYRSYDTKELISSLIKKGLDGDYLSTKEILETRGGELVSPEFATKKKRRYRKKRS